MEGTGRGTLRCGRWSRPPPRRCHRFAAPRIAMTLFDWHHRPTRAEPAPLPAATLRQFFLLLWRFDMEREADAAASLFIERADLVPPDRTIPALMEALSGEHGEPYSGPAPP